MAGISRQTAAASAAPQQEEIARLAYAFYEQRGRTPGNELDDWLEAERILWTRSQSSKRAAARRR
jgi:hypothetical protein